MSDVAAPVQVTLVLPEASAVELAEAIATIVDYDYWRWSAPPLDRITRLDAIYLAIAAQTGVAMAEREAHPQPERIPPAPRKEPIPPALRWAVFKRDSYACVRCGADVDLTVDHIHPESLGGPTVLENLQTLCRGCNSSKGARP